MLVDPDRAGPHVPHGLDDRRRVVALQPVPRLALPPDAVIEARALDGHGRVLRDGYRKRELKIYLRPDALHRLGVTPTPAVAFEAARLGAMGAVVSASHNPYHDNGIKLFDVGGTKLPDDVEGRIRKWQMDKVLSGDIITAIAMTEPPPRAVVFPYAMPPRASGAAAKTADTAITVWMPSSNSVH